MNHIEETLCASLTTQMTPYMKVRFEGDFRHYSSGRRRRKEHGTSSMTLLLVDVASSSTYPDFRFHPGYPKRINRLLIKLRF